MCTVMYPMPTESIGGKKYFVTFIDDYSRVCEVNLIKNMSEVFNKFKVFEMCTTRGGSRGVSVVPRNYSDSLKFISSLKFYIMHITNSAILYNARCMSISCT